MHKGQMIKMDKKDQFIDYVRYSWQLVTGARSEMEKQGAEWRKRDLAPFINETYKLRVLDLANGRLRPQYSLLKAEGHKVVGIDLINRPNKDLLEISYRIARRLFIWRLGLPRTTSWKNTLVCGNVATLPFKSNLFDLVTSIAAFEHFLDVPTTLFEIHRVMCSGGLLWVVIHPFTALSGGHNVKLSEIPLRSLPSGAEPWDHLRHRNLPFYVPLNELRIDQYLKEFSRYFEILNHYCAAREGDHLITPEIEAELSDYSQDELTCGAYVIVARKPFA